MNEEAVEQEVDVEQETAEIDPDAIEVKVIDDDAAPQEASSENEDDDEEGDLDESQLSNRIQKRIAKLRYEFHEERRKSDAFKKENAEAIKYAKSVQQENESLKNQSADLRKLLYEQVSEKTDTELGVAKQRFQDAYESGDADALVQAQSDMARLNAEKIHFSVESDAINQAQQNQVAAPQQEAVQQQEVPPPDPMAVDWLKNNPWFQSPGNERMTGFAVGLHEELVKQGVDPRGNTDYYRQIDAALHEQFPNFFEKGKDNVSKAPTSRKAPVVSPSKRGSGKAPRQVELTDRQVTLARKLGVTPERYAAQLMKEMSNG